MQIIIKTKNIELNGPLETFINDKMGKLQKFLHSDTQEVFVEIERETKHHNKGEIFFAEAIVSLPGKKLVARASGDDLRKAIGEVKEELETEIKKYKNKKIELPRRQARKANSQENF